MESLRATILPLVLAGFLAGLLAWQGWRFWENAIGHETIALKIGAVFVPAIVAGLIYGIARAGVQNSGGEGNAGVCVAKISQTSAMLKPARPPSSNSARTSI